MKRVSAPMAEERKAASDRAARKGEAAGLKSKGVKRTPAERDRLLDLLCEQVFGTP